MDGSAVAFDMIHGLLVALGDEDPVVRYNAVQALAKMRGSAVTPDVINGLLATLDDESKDVRL
ncbi:unnamed protein product, partial [Didymodactylos carnosus]